MSLSSAVAHYRITTQPGESDTLDFDAGRVRFRWLIREGGIAEVVIPWT